MKKLLATLLSLLCIVELFCACENKESKENYSAKGEYSAYHLVSDIDFFFANAELLENTRTIWYFEEDEKDKTKGTCGYDSTFNGSVLSSYSIKDNEIFWENSFTKKKEKYLLYKEYIIHSEAVMKNKSLKREDKKLNGVCSYSDDYCTIELTFYHSGKIDVLHTFEDGYRMYKGEYELDGNIIILNLGKVNNYNQVEEMNINTYLYFDGEKVNYYLFKKQ